MVVTRRLRKCVQDGTGVSKNMTAEIEDYVKRCDVCQRVNDRFCKPPATLYTSNSSDTASVETGVIIMAC